MKSLKKWFQRVAST